MNLFYDAHAAAIMVAASGNFETVYFGKNGKMTLIDAARPEEIVLGVIKRRKWEHPIVAVVIKAIKDGDVTNENDVKSRYGIYLSQLIDKVQRRWKVGLRKDEALHLLTSIQNK